MVNLKWNWNEVEAKGNDEYKRLVPGGYVCRITAVEDHPEKEYLYLEFDITEGEYKGYGAGCMERNGFTPLKMYRSYTDKAACLFKGFIESVNASNPNAPAWDGNEQKLVGKYIGVILREEEYKKQDGSIGVRFGVSQTKTPADIRTGNFRVPAKKTLPVEQTAPAFAPADDAGELPF